LIIIDTFPPPLRHESFKPSSVGLSLLESRRRLTRRRRKKEMFLFSKACNTCTAKRLGLTNLSLSSSPLFLIHPQKYSSSTTTACCRLSGPTRFLRLFPLLLVARHISLSSAFGTTHPVKPGNKLSFSPSSSSSSSSSASLISKQFMTSSTEIPTTSSSSPVVSLLSPLSGSDLRDLVLQASTRDAATTLDLQGLVWLEHINLVVGNKEQAEYFYVQVLGCTRDDTPSFHVNLGQQQFHLAEKNEDPAQVITGSIGLAVPSLQALRERLNVAMESSSSSSQRLKDDTQFAVLEDSKSIVTVQGPWGNRFHCYQVDDYGGNDEPAPLLPLENTPQKMTNLHSTGGSYGPRMAVREQPGIRFVEFVVPQGTASKVASFYKDTLGCTVQEFVKEKSVTVSVGPGVHLVFVEQQQAKVNNDDQHLLLQSAMDAMKGVHICVYTHNFETLYHRLYEKNLIWTNPRFTHLDSCDTYEAAAASRTLRFRYVVDEDNNRVLELEHETRPLRHGQYLKVPKYQPMQLPSIASTGNPALSSRVLETLDPCVVLMKELVGQYAPIWNTNDKGGIFSLAQGVVYWKPPVSCNEALQQALNDDDSLLHTYAPDQGIPELIDALQTKISTENNLHNHNVMVTVGANQAYVNCILTLLDQESKAVVFAPYYFNHVMAIQMACGDDAVVVGPTSTDGIPDLEWLTSTLQSNPSSIRLVTIVNPGNPTGVSLSREYLQQVVDVCCKHNVWLILDCTYEYFTHSSLHHQPLATFGNDPHVIHIFSFSKSYALAGYRCGYVVTHQDAKGLYDNLMKVQDTIPIAPPRLSQIVALGALQAGKEWVYEQYGTLEESRQLILNALKPLVTMGGSGSMYVMAQLPATLSLQVEEDGNPNEAIDLMVGRRMVRDYGIAIIPGSFCGFDGWIRVCYANLTPEKCRIAAKRLQDGIANIVLANS
jgi:aromatic aminotransferase